MKTTKKMTNKQNVCVCKNCVFYSADTLMCFKHDFTMTGNCSCGEFIYDDTLSAQQRRLKEAWNECKKEAKYALDSLITFIQNFIDALREVIALTNENNEKH